MKRSRDLNVKNLVIEEKNPVRAVFSDSFLVVRTRLEGETIVNYSKFVACSEWKIPVRAEF